MAILKLQRSCGNFKIAMGTHGDFKIAMGTHGDFEIAAGVLQFQSRHGNTWRF